MKRHEKAFTEAAGCVQRAALKTVKDFNSAHLPDEPNFTAAFVTRIYDDLNGFVSSGITWKARIVSPRAEEPILGADFVGMLWLNLSGYSVRKWFLAQAKRQEPGNALPPSHWNDLAQQCKAMLRYTNESYVFIYSRNGIVVVPAKGVVSCSSHQDLYQLFPQSVKVFFMRHFECWVGQMHDLRSFEASLKSGISQKMGLWITGTVDRETEESRTG